MKLLFSNSQKIWNMFYIFWVFIFNAKIFFLMFKVHFLLLRRNWVSFIDIKSPQNRLLKVCYVPATTTSLNWLLFFTAAVNSTNEANKAGSMHRSAVYILRCLWLAYWGPAASIASFDNKLDTPIDIYEHTPI